jgi:hypothetical protein
MKKQCIISVSVCLEIVVLRFIVRWLKMLRIIKKQVKFTTKFSRDLYQAGLYKRYTIQCKYREQTVIELQRTLVIYV